MALHRNIKPTWYGIVLAKHMQDPTLSSELKALIGVVATFPRENWKWRGDHLRSLLNWGRERWQRTMREAKDRGFVKIHKVSAGKGKIHTEYAWNIDTPKPALNGASIHRSGKSTDDKIDGRKTRLHNDVVRSNDEVKGKEKTGATHSDDSQKRETESSGRPERVETLPAPSKSKPSSATVRDPRFDSFREHLARGHAKNEYSFTDRDGAALKRLLHDQPLLTFEKFKRCLENYFDSEDVPASSVPWMYLPKLMLYASGPLSKFQKRNGAAPRHDVAEESLLTRNHREWIQGEDRRPERRGQTIYCNGELCRACCDYKEKYPDATTPEQKRKAGRAA